MPISMSKDLLLESPTSSIACKALALALSTSKPVLLLTSLQIALEPWSCNDWTTLFMADVPFFVVSIPSLSIDLPINRPSSWWLVLNFAYSARLLLKSSAISGAIFSMPLSILPFTLPIIVFKAISSWSYIGCLVIGSLGVFLLTCFLNNSSLLPVNSCGILSKNFKVFAIFGLISSASIASPSKSITWSLGLAPSISAICLTWYPPYSIKSLFISESSSFLETASICPKYSFLIFPMSSPTEDFKAPYSL